MFPIVHFCKFKLGYHVFFFANPSHVSINPLLHIQAMFSGINICTSKPYFYVSISAHPSHVSMYVSLNIQAMIPYTKSIFPMLYIQTMFPCINCCTCKLGFHIYILLHIQATSIYQLPQNIIQSLFQVYPF